MDRIKHLYISIHQEDILSPVDSHNDTCVIGINIYISITIQHVYIFNKDINDYMISVFGNLFFLSRSTVANYLCDTNYI